MTLKPFEEYKYLGDDELVRGGKGRTPAAEMSLLAVPSGVSCDSSASSFSRTSRWFSSCRGVSHIPRTGTASWGGREK